MHVAIAIGDDNKVTKNTTINKEEIYSFNNEKGVLCDFNAVYYYKSISADIDVNGLMILYNPTGTTDLLGVAILYTDNCDCNYVEDFYKVIQSVESDSGTKNKTDSPTKGIRPEFKAAMDSYEKFFDEYAAFMEKYNESSDSLSMFSDYLDYLERYYDTLDKLDKMGDEEMSDEELAYYTEVMLRVNMKLLGSLS